MVFTNALNDVTMAPANPGQMQAFQAAQAYSSGKTFAQAAAVNRIYQNNGLICQRMMCQSMTGCDSAVDCPNHPEWDKVVDFCGQIGTPSMSMDGSYWRLQPADSQQQLLSATKRATGLSQLPTPYNVGPFPLGMYP